MKRITSLLFLLFSTTNALAWDGPELWYASATADSPGGGGILGTGGAHDYGVKCSHCHVERPMTSNLAFSMQFSPALPMSGSEQSYMPGQRYTVTAKVTGATLGSPCSDPYGKNVDNFAAAFEDVNGAPAGGLESDTGSSTANCLQTVPMPDDAGTTALTGDCEVIFSKGSENMQTWTFYWTAPASGEVKIAWGAVDGDCLMMSMKDAVVEGTTVLRSPQMARAPRPAPDEPNWRLALASMAIAGVTFVPRRRRSSDVQ